MSDSKPLIVGYWSIRGLAAPLRMLLMFTGTKFHAENYDLLMPLEGGFDASCWFGVKPELKAKNPLINLPYVIDGDVIISQSNACLSYLGKKYGLWGDSVVDSIFCDELLCEIMDLRNKIVQFSYGSHADNAGSAKILLDDVTGKNGILQKLELCLNRNLKNCNGEFLVGNHATAPDFHLWEMIDQYVLLAKFYVYDSPLLSFPLLQSFYEKFAELPQNAAYFASPLSKMPPNQKMAQFGATPTGEKFVAGQAYDWGNCSGVY